MKLFLNCFIIVLFFVHGILMFSVGGSVQEISFVKYVKYILFFFFIAININVRGVLKLWFPVIFFILYFLLYKCSSYSHNLSLTDFTTRYLNLFCPFFLVCIPVNIIPKNYLIKTINFIAFSSALFSFMEYILFRHIITSFNFIDQGGFYRCISFYINPNNAASIFSLLIIFYFHQIIRKGSNLYRIFIILLLGGAAVLTGSKTPILVLGSYFFIYTCLYLYFKKSINKKFFKIFSCVAVVLTIILFVFFYLADSGVYTFRKMHAITDDGRYSQLVEFISLLPKHFWAPNYTALDEVMYDNVYLQLWSDFSFVGLILIGGVIFYFLLVHYRKLSLSMLAFFMMWFLLGFSLNTFYIWPLSYIFWYMLFNMSTEHDKLCLP